MHHPTGLVQPSLTTAQNILAGGSVTNYGGTVPAITRSLIRQWMIAALPIQSFVDAAASANARHYALLGSAGTFGLYFYNDAFTDNREAFQISGTSSAIALFRVQVAQMVLGHTAAITVGNSGKFQVLGNTDATSQAQISRFSNDTSAPILAFSKSASGTVGTNTIVGNNYFLGDINAYGANGSSYSMAAQIRFFMDGTPGATNDMPGAIGFSTSPDGTATVVEALRVDSTQTLRTGTTNRNTNSGAKLQTIAGTQTTNSASVGGTIYSNTTQTGNTAATETDAFSHTVVGSTLTTNRDGLEFFAAGTISSTASVDKRIKVKFGATTIFDSGNLAVTTAVSWSLRGTVIRTGAGTQKATVDFVVGDPAVNPMTSYTTPTETLSGNVTMKLTIQGTNASDVVAELYKEKWSSAA